MHALMCAYAAHSYLCANCSASDLMHLTPHPQHSINRGRGGGGEGDVSLQVHMECDQEA